MACVGGGSNAIGIFTEFVDDPDVRLIGVEVGFELGMCPLPAVPFLDVWMVLTCMGWASSQVMDPYNCRGL